MNDREQKRATRSGTKSSSPPAPAVERTSQPPSLSSPPPKNTRLSSPLPPAPSGARPKPDAPQGYDLGFELPQPAQVSRTRGWLTAGLVLLLVAGAFALGYLPRHRASSALAETTRSASQKAVRVDTILPKHVDDTRNTVLPGSVLPLSSTVLYARSEGYVRGFYADLGDRVKEGQKLAEIETPELDQQLEQARAQLLQAEAGLGQAKANRDLANTSLTRYQALRPAGVASQQELDQRSAQALVDESNVHAAEAAVAVQRANVRRLVQLKAFANVIAPFDGMITSRTIEPGALVSTGRSTPLFELTATDPVRVFVQVPQDLAPTVQVKAKAQVMVREYPSRTFEGVVTRSAGALDVATRTMKTEVRVPNHDNALLTGMYAQVSLPLASPHPVFELPATAVINDANGQRVAVVGDDGLIHMRPIGIERDLGSTIQIARGVGENDRIVKLGGNALNEGQKVDAKAAK